MILRYLIAIAVCAMATTATAQDRGAVSAGLGVTSFGYALEGAYQLRPTLGLRGMIMGGFSIDDTFDYEGSSVNGTADLGGTAVVADYYPLANACACPVACSFPPAMSAVHSPKGLLPMTAS